MVVPKRLETGYMYVKDVEGNIIDDTVIQLQYRNSSGQLSQPFIPDTIYKMVLPSSTGPC